MRGHRLCDPSHSGMGGMHWCHLDPLTETSRGGSSPISPSAWKHYPRVLQGFRRRLLRRGLCPPPPSQSMGPCHRASPRCQLPRGRTFPLSPTEQKELDEFLRENLVNSHIHPSKSPIGAPVFFIKKKDGSLHLVQDYWKLNKIMVKNSYPLPLVSNVLTHLCGAECFTVLNLHWGFNNVQIKEGDEWKAAFQTNQGLFEPTVMFFGLCNSPMTFQMMMNDILHEFIDCGKVICYMDDILVYSPTLSEHQQIVHQVLATLQRQRLFLKPEKCKFKQKEVKYLRLAILKDHVAMDLTKVHRVTEWPTPMKVKEVQSFLGFVNFYWKFIVMVQPPFPFSAHLFLPLSPSTSAPPLLPPLHSNSEACLHNLCNCVMPTLGLTADQHQTHSDLVPMPRATICIPFLHLSYLPDPFSLTIMGNYSFLV